MIRVRINRRQTRPRRRPRYRTVTAFACYAALAATWLTPLALEAQRPTEKTKEQVHVVFRISKPFFDDVVGKQQIDADIPFTGTVLGLGCSGVIHGSATPALQIQEHSQSATVLVRASGTGSAVGNCARGPLRVTSPMWGPFTTETTIDFDGRKFSQRCTLASVDLEGCLQQVSSRRNRRLGRVMARGLTPFVKKLMPRAIEEATPIAERHVRDYVSGMADEIIVTLNRRSPVEATLNRVFPDTRDWAIQLSADQQSIQVAYGPPGAAIPALEDAGQHVDQPRVEVWLLSTTSEAQALAKLASSPLAKQLIDRYLEANLPELIRLGDQRVVTDVGQWLRIEVGMSDAPDS